MPEPYRMLRTVEFSETDAAGIVHFTRMLQWLEAAEARFLGSIGLRLFSQETDGTRLGFPRVGLNCDFLKPVQFGDTVAVCIELQSVSNSSATYVFRIESEQGGSLIASGSYKVVYAQIPVGGPPRAIPLPEVMRSYVSGNPSL
jgi:acyl-CoA thioester hydrolase